MKKVLLVLAIALAWAAAQAQSNPALDRLAHLMQAHDLDGDDFMEAYAQSMDTLDIRVSAPEGFAQVPVDMFFLPNPEYRSRYFHGYVGQSMLGPAYVSQAQDAVIVYPLSPDGFGGIVPDRLVEAEMIAGYECDSLDITDMITIINDTGDTGADWIIEYEFDTADPNWSGHPHCVGLAMRKKNHTSFLLKIFLSDEGLKHKGEYVAAALGCVRYGDQYLPYFAANEGNTGLLPNVELSFPKPKYVARPGIIM